MQPSNMPVISMPKLLPFDPLHTHPLAPTSQRDSVTVHPSQRRSFLPPPLSNKIVYLYIVFNGDPLGERGARKHRKNPLKWWDEFSFKGRVQTGTNKNRVGPCLLRAVIGRVAYDRQTEREREREREREAFYEMPDNVETDK